MPRTQQSQSAKQTAKESPKKEELDFSRKYTTEDIKNAEKGHYFYLVGHYGKNEEPEHAYIAGAPGRFKRDPSFVFYRPLKLAGSREHVLKYLSTHFNKKDYDLDNEENVFTSKNTAKGDKGVGEGSQRKAYDEMRTERRDIAQNQSTKATGLLSKVDGWLGEIKNKTAAAESKQKKTKSKKEGDKKAGGGARKQPLFQRLKTASDNDKVLDVTSYTETTLSAKAISQPGEHSKKVRVGDYPIVASGESRDNLERFLNNLKSQSMEVQDKDETAAEYAEIDVEAILKEFDSSTVSSKGPSKSGTGKSATKKASPKKASPKKEEVIVPVIGRGNVKRTFKGGAKRLANISSPKAK